MAATQHRTLFISASPIEAYRKWKSYWGLTHGTGASGQATLIADEPNKAVRWRGRFGMARVYGRADFIPVQGGCMVYLAFTSAGGFSRLLLSTPLERLFWRTADGFRAIADGLKHEGAA